MTPSEIGFEDDDATALGFDQNSEPIFMGYMNLAPAAKIVS